MCFICMNSFNLATSLTKNTNIFMFYIKNEAREGKCPCQCHTRLALLEHIEHNMLC